MTRDRRIVGVTLDVAHIDYLLEHMLTYDLRTRPNPGAATVVRKIVTDAIAAHRKQVLAVKVAACAGPNRTRLMAGR